MKNSSIFYLVIILLIYSNLFAAPPASQTSESKTQKQDSKDIEINNLKLEIQRLKNEMSKIRTMDNGSGPPIIRPSNMSEDEFIEIHREFQNKQESKNGDYPTSLIMEYKKMMLENPSERSYCYLYDRLLPDSEERSKLTDMMIEKWPNFYYPYLIKLLFLKAQTTPQCTNIVNVIEKLLFLKPESNRSNEFKNELQYYKKSIEGINIATNLKLTYDLSEMRRNNSSSNINVMENGINNININCYIEYKKELKRTTIKFNYLKLIQENGTLILVYELSYSGYYPWTQFAYVYKDGKESNNYETSLYVNSTELLSKNGIITIRIRPDILLDFKEIRLVRFNNM